LTTAEFETFFEDQMTPDPKDPSRHSLLLENSLADDGTLSEASKKDLFGKILVEGFQTNNTI
jgi:hypothetical protein